MRITAILSGIICVLGSSDAGAQQEPKPKPEPIKIELRSAARIPGNTVLVRDLVVLSADDRALFARFGDLQVGSAPLSGWARRVSRIELARILTTGGLPKDRFVISGSASCEVLADTIQVGVPEIIRTAETVLQALLDDEGDSDAQFEVVQRPRAVLAPRGRVSRRLVARVPKGRTDLARASLRVDVVVDDKVVGSAPVGFRVRRFRERLVAQRAIRRGEMATRDDFILERVEVTGRNVDVVTDPGRLLGQMYARRINRGDVLRARDLRRAAVIRKNDIVRLVALSGKVRIVVTATAQSDGGIGETIAFKWDKKIPPVTAVVQGPGLAVRNASLRSAVSRIGRANLPFGARPDTARRSARRGLEPRDHALRSPKPRDAASRDAASRNSPTDNRNSGTRNSSTRRN